MAPHGFGQGELIGQREQFTDRLLAGDRFIWHTSDLTRQDYLERATAGTKSCPTAGGPTTPADGRLSPGKMGGDDH